MKHYFSENLKNDKFVYNAPIPVVDGSFGNLGDTQCLAIKSYRIKSK